MPKTVIEIKELINRYAKDGEFVVDWSRETFDATEVANICTALIGAAVHTLDLSYSCVHANKILALAELKNTQIHTLNLSGNVLNVEDVTALMAVLKDTQVHNLNLKEISGYDDMGMGPEHLNAAVVTALVTGLKDTQIHVLHLSNNGMLSKEALMLVSGLKNTKIHTLDISNNFIHEYIASALTFSGTQVHTLNFHNNIYYSPIKLARALANTDVTYVSGYEGHLDETLQANLGRKQAKMVALGVAGALSQLNFDVLSSVSEFIQCLDPRGNFDQTLGAAMDFAYETVMPKLIFTAGNHGAAKVNADTALQFEPKVNSRRCCTIS